MSYEIAPKELASQPVVAIRATTTRDRIGPLLDELLPEVWRYAEAQGAQPAGPPFARYHAFEPDRVELEAGFPVSNPLPGEGRVVAGHLPQGRAAVTMHVGPYDTLSAAYMALEAWIAEQGRRPAGAPWEVYLSDPREEPDSARWRTEVVWPIE